MKERRVYWCGNSYEELMDFPTDARRHAGYQLGEIQNDKEPYDWKPMSDIGPGVREITLTEQSGEYRVLYVVKIAEWVHVLHCFFKNTRATPLRNVRLAKERYKEVETHIALLKKQKK